MSKIKAIPAAPPLTLLEIEELVASIANLEYIRAESARDIASKQADCDFQINQIRDAFLPLIEQLEALKKTVDQAINEKVAKVATWAAANPERFGKRRSLVLTCGTIGYRLNPPRIEAMKGWTLAKCALAMQEIAGWLAYLKPPVVDKERLLRDRDILNLERLPEVGIQIVQTDQFYVEPKRERDDTLTGRAAA